MTIFKAKMFKKEFNVKFIDIILALNFVGLAVGIAMVYHAKMTMGI